MKVPIKAPASSSFLFLSLLIMSALCHVALSSVLCLLLPGDYEYAENFLHDNHSCLQVLPYLTTANLGYHLKKITIEYLKPILSILSKKIIP